MYHEKQQSSVTQYFQLRESELGLHDCELSTVVEAF